MAKFRLLFLEVFGCFHIKPSKNFYIKVSRWRNLSDLSSLYFKRVLKRIFINNNISEDKLYRKKKSRIYIFLNISVSLEKVIKCI